MEISVLTSLLESLSPVDTFWIQKAKKGCVLVATSPGSYAAVRAPQLEIEGLKEGALCLDFKSFSLGCKNREVALSFTGHDLKIKSGKYEAEIATTEAGQAPALVTPENCSTEILIDEEAKAFLQNAIRSTKINLTYTGITDTLVYVESKQSLLVCTYEPNQIAYSLSKNKFPACSFVLTSGIMSKILAMPGELNLSINEYNVTCTSKVGSVQIPIPIETVNAVKKEQVMALIKSAKASANSSAQITKVELSKFLDNSGSVLTGITGADAVVTGSEKSVLITVTTPRGSVKEKFKGSVTKPFTLSYAFLQAIATKSGDEVTITTSDRLAIVNTGSCVYLAVLSDHQAKI